MTNKLREVSEIAEQYEEIVADDFSKNKIATNWKARKDWLTQTLTADREAVLNDFAEFAHTRYNGTDGKEYAYSQEVIYMVEDYLALTNKTE